MVERESVCDTTMTYGMLMKVNLNEEDAPVMSIGGIRFLVVNVNCL